MSESGPLKNLSHKLLTDYVCEFATDIPSEGVCNGFTSMWIQAIETDDFYTEENEVNFYKRLDWLSEYFSYPCQSPKTLRKEIDSIFLKAEKKRHFTKEELNSIDKRAFAESIAIQQDANSLKLMSPRYISQNKKTFLYKLTISKALQLNNKKINSSYIAVMAPSIKKLKQYFDDIQATLLNIERKKKFAFMFSSDNHAVGLYFNSLTQKWRFLNINFLSKKEEYYYEVNSSVLAPLIFDSFYDHKNSRTLFSLYHLSLSYPEKPDTVTQLKMITNILLTNSIGHANSRGYNTLMLASLNGDIDTVEDLIEKCPTLVNATNIFGATPLLTAAQEGHFSVIKRLIKAGANVNLTNKKEKTPLMFAAINGHSKCINKLIEIGANVNNVDFEGYTALMYAVRNGDNTIIETLIKAKAAVNQANKKGHTALMLAAAMGATPAIEKLIFYGADVNLKDNLGRTALMLASENTHSESARILKTPTLLFLLKRSYRDFINSFAATKRQSTPEQIKQSELLFNLRRLRV